MHAAHSVHLSDTTTVIRSTYKSPTYLSVKIGLLKVVNSALFRECVRSNHLDVWRVIT